MDHDDAATTQPPPTPTPDVETEVVSRDYAADVVDSGDAAGRKWVVARITTDAVDRYGTVIDPAGVRVADYMKNPVVLWEHGKDPARGRVPIGRADWVKPRPSNRDIVARTVFADDEFSRNLFELYRDGILRGWSVNGNSPGKPSPPTAAETRTRPELRACKGIYRTLEMTEYSAVAIPGNPDALTEATARGLWLPDALRPTPAAGPETTPGLPPLTPSRVWRPEVPRHLPPLDGARTLADALAESVARAARHARVEAARIADDARDLARGKV